jgi:Domain of unknown function (DUF4389)
MHDYPVRFSVDYPDRPLNRLTTGFRFITVIPIAILVAALEHVNVQVGRHWFDVTTAGGLIVLATVLMLLFRQKYPRWWFDWNLEFSRFTSRVTVYWLLMDDRYPSTDDHQSVHLDFPEVSGPELNRWLPLVKWFLAIPHYIVLVFLGLAAFFVVVFAWFAILFTGRYPRGAFEFVEGVLRWGNRVGGYAFVLVTDKYPPFSLSP